MKKIELDKETADWLIAFLSGELDSEEERKIGEWIEAGDRNREAYEALLRDYLRVRWVRESVNIREDRARRVIFSSLKKKRNPWIYYGVAASVAVLLAVSTFLFTRESRVGSKPVEVAVAEVSPVHSQAVLVLSTGERVDLTQGHREIREKDGSIVNVDSALRVSCDTARVDEAAELIYNKVIVPRGGEYMVTLSEGTRVWLDADSELEYPVSFTGESREVKLKGQAYFDVTGDKNRPFIVRSGEYALRVYGTEFNVNAYDSRRIETVLVEGTVGFRANASAVERKMQPGELALADTRTGESEIRGVDVYPYIAWKNRDIVFENERLESIMEKIARWYDVSVFFQNASLKDLRFDCNMQRYADIKDLLFYLEKTSDAGFTLNGRTLIVSDKK